MSFVSQVSILMAAFSPSSSAAPPPLLVECRRHYSEWDEKIAAADALSGVDVTRGAAMRKELEDLGGKCLVALQNDLEDVQESEGWFRASEKAAAARGGQAAVTAAQTVQSRALEVEVGLRDAGPTEWETGATFHGNALTEAVDYRKPVPYLRDAQKVATSWAYLVERFTPVLPDLVARMKPWVGLAVDTRDCRALWILAHRGQAPDPRSARELPVRQRIGFCLAALQNDVEALEKHLRSLESQPKNVEVADVEWNEPTLHGAAVGSVQSAEVDIDKYLIDSHLVHKTRNEIWQAAEQEAAPGLGDSIHSIQAFRGLRDLISLLLTTEVALLDMRRDGDRGVFAPEDAKAKTTPTASLLIESEHFGAERSPYAHSSFGGTLAALPTLNLLAREGAADGRIYPTFQQAFVWDLNGRLHSQWFERMEVSALGFVGQSILLDDKSLVERGEDFVGVPVENAAGRAEIFRGWLVEARAFDLGLDIIHGESSYLNPRFSIAFGERWNERFVPPEGLGIPEDRWKKSRLFRFRWNIRNTIASRDRYEKPLLVTFSFGLEREWWPGNRALPSTTTLFFSGDFDLNKIIKSKE